MHIDDELMENTKNLSALSLGAWFRIARDLSGSPTPGKNSLTVAQWAHVCHCRPSEIEIVLWELEGQKVCQVQRSNGAVTLFSEWIQKRAEARKMGTKRVQEHRSRHISNVKVIGEAHLVLVTVKGE